jgi:hypothetical protein
MELLGSRQLSVVANLCVRTLMGYFGLEALKVTVVDPNDHRFQGKGIAMRNALVLGAFSTFLPLLYRRNKARRGFPWGADAMLISVPVVDMAGNSFDLYNDTDWFDVLAHLYGNVVGSSLLMLAMEGRNREPRLVRWVVAAGGATFLHVWLEIQEYWTDVFLKTQNVESLEDTEGDILMGACGAIMGVALAELALNGPLREAALAEGRRLAATLGGDASANAGRLKTDSEIGRRAA